MKKEKLIPTIRSATAEYLTFVSSTGDSEKNIEMRYEDENIWLTQKMMAEIYDVDVRTINEHIQKIFNDQELHENSVIRKYRITASDGKNYNTLHYNSLCSACILQQNSSWSVLILDVKIWD